MSSSSASGCGWSSGFWLPIVSIYQHESMLQESMDAVRKDFFSLDVKPRCGACGRDNVSESSSPGHEFSATETLYLRMSGNAEGVVQVHRAPCLHREVLDIAIRQTTLAGPRLHLKMPYKDIASCFGQKKYGFSPNANSNSRIGLPNCSSAW